MGHDHHHTRGNVGIAFFINLLFTVIEIIGGLLTNSVAILSDAVHDLGDSFALGLAWIMDRVSRKGPTPRYSFGLKRFSLLAALINALILVGGSVFVLTQAIPRLWNPLEADAQGMLLLSLLGIGFNGFAVWRTSRGKSMNEKVMTWHLLEDLLGWIAVLITSILLIFTQWYILDPLLSVLITLVILTGVIKNLRKTLFLFLQGVPDDLLLSEVKEIMLTQEGVDSIHDLHLWSLDGEHHVLSAHVRLQEDCSWADLSRIKGGLKERLSCQGIDHSTLEMEAHDEICGGSCES